MEFTVIHVDAVRPVEYRRGRHRFLNANARSKDYPEKKKHTKTKKSRSSEAKIRIV